MKKLRLLWAILALSPIAGCAALGVVVGKTIVTNSEMIMLLKVSAYFLVALILIGAVLLMLIGTILAIGKGLGLSQGDTRSALQAAIALARGSSTINKLYGRATRGALPPGSGYIPNYYQSSFEGSAFGGPVINGEANMPPDTEPANSEAWER